MINPIDVLESRLQGRKAVEVAREMGISPQFLSMVRYGVRPPPEPILRWLGLERVVIYQKVKRK